MEKSMRKQEGMSMIIVNYNKNIRKEKYHTYAANISFEYLL